MSLGHPYILGPRGEHLLLLRPKDSPISIDSMAYALARLPRFTGHTKGEPYSVAQHSVGASYIVKPGFEREALLHDGTEFVLNDISSPLKQLLPDYRAIEGMWDAEIRRRFNLPLSMSPEVHHADLVMLATEYRDLVPPDSEEWEVIRDIEPIHLPITPWPWGFAYNRFMVRASELGLL